MNQGTTDPRAQGLDAFVQAYESAQAAGGADLDHFLPERGHPLYLGVLRELVRVELEFGWGGGRARPLEEYQRRYPELFRDRTSVEQIAFEEYRLRHQAGERPSPAEYA